MPIYTTLELFDLSKTMAAPLLESAKYPWETLDGIAGFILQAGPLLPPEEYSHPAEGVWIAKTATVAPSASINGPCIIGPGAQLRHCAYIRGSAIVGAGAVVGNSVELKNCILFDDVQAPHFNYVGDSILGYKSHMGAGAITSNVKSDRSPVIVKCGREEAHTGRKKLGAMLGDGAEVGCNSVLNPGAMLGRNCTIYPTSCVRGLVEENSIFKNTGEMVKKR